VLPGEQYDFARFFGVSTPGNLAADVWILLWGGNPAIAGVGVPFDHDGMIPERSDRCH
jgi:hypothetical protein